MKNLTITIAIAIASSSAATAGIVDMKFTGKGAGSNVQIQLGESNPFNVFAGELNHQITNATGIDSYLNGSHRTYCADITEHVTSEFAQYQTTDLQNIPLTINNPNPMSEIQANAIRALYNQNAPTLLEGNLSNAFAAAIQLTIWEIVTDFNGTAASINLTQGNLTIEGTNGDPINQDIISHIDTLKIQIMAGINLNQQGQNQVIGLSNAGAQDQLITVPAPGAFALLTTGALLISRRRRN